VTFERYDRCSGVIGEKGFVNLNFIWEKKQTRKFFFIKPISGYPIKFSRLSGAEMAELLISNSQLAFYISSFTDETLIRRKDNKISAGIVFSLFVLFLFLL
jgi:hypothetical protein